MVDAPDAAITYRQLDQLDEFRAVVALQRAVWGTDSFDPVPLHVFQAVTVRGGVLVGAQHQDQMVGFAFAFPAREGGRWFLWSHIAGVHPDFQGQGIGFRLKQMQRAWALANGYEVMGWTFDPMQRGNANFNVRLLGAVSNTYKLNIYGVMTDAVNFGLQSDRLAVTWRLDDPRVARLAAGEAPEPVATDHPEDRFLLRLDAQTGLVMKKISSPDTGSYFAEIPTSLNRLKASNLDLAREWQLALRDTLQAAFAAGLWVVDITASGERCWYVLQRMEA